CRAQLIEQVHLVRPATGAVAADAEGRATSEGEVVRKRRVADGEVAGVEPEVVCKPVDVRPGGIADHSAVLTVLEYQHGHVREAWWMRRDNLRRSGPISVRIGEHQDHGDHSDAPQDPERSSACASSEHTPIVGAAPENLLKPGRWLNKR